MQHIGQAQAAGWSEAQVDAIESGRLDRLPTGVAAVLAFCDDCVLGQATDEVCERTRRHVGDRRIVTTVVLVGHYMTVARLTGILGVELDQAPDAWAGEH